MTPHIETINDRKLSKQERDARDIEIINRNADALNEEALDVLSYQIELNKADD